MYFLFETCIVKHKSVFLLAFWVEHLYISLTKHLFWIGNRFGDCCRNFYEQVVRLKIKLDARFKVLEGDLATLLSRKFKYFYKLISQIHFDANWQVVELLGSYNCCLVTILFDWFAILPKGFEIGIWNTFVFNVLLHSKTLLGTVSKLWLLSQVQIATLRAQLYCIVLYFMVHYIIVYYIMYSTELYCTVLCSIVLYRTEL